MPLFVKKHDLAHNKKIKSKKKLGFKPSFLLKLNEFIFHIG